LKNLTKSKEEFNHLHKYSLEQEQKIEIFANKLEEQNNLLSDEMRENKNQQYKNIELDSLTQNLKIELDH